jgi:DNA invertase Pin-like site-specific DNA recombinase
MKGQNVGYLRTSSVSQKNTERQLADVDLDRTFTDKVSGKDTNRPELKNCLNHVREGDVLHVHSIDRLARNLKDLQTIIEQLTDKGVTVKFYKELLTFDGTSASPMNKLMLQMLGAFAEFERTLIKERQREGIAAARAMGKKLGAPSKLSSGQISIIKTRIDAGEEKSKLAKEFSISRPTLYKLLSNVKI